MTRVVGLLSLALLACSQDAPVAVPPVDATTDDVQEASANPFEGFEGGPPIHDAGLTLHDACPSGDAAVLWRSCELNPCPSGYVCAIEIGGVAGGGDDRCIQIVDGCVDTPSCECLGNCGCQFKNKIEACWTSRRDAGADGASWLLVCDNFIR